MDGTGYNPPCELSADWWALTTANAAGTVLDVLSEVRNTYIHMNHSRLTPEGVAEATQIFLRDSHVLSK
jgi:hypothetical protein